MYDIFFNLKFNKKMSQFNYGVIVTYVNKLEDALSFWTNKNFDFIKKFEPFIAIGFD